MSISRRHVRSNCTGRLSVFLGCIEGLLLGLCQKVFVRVTLHLTDTCHGNLMQADTPATRLEGVGSVKRLSVLLPVFDLMWHRKIVAFPEVWLP